jgi:hypothetical protein
MEFLADLWLPIVLSSVLVFLVSSLLHMVLPIHRGDFGKLPNEDDVLASMRDKGVGPGQYMFPCPASMKDMATPEMKARFEKGPVGTMIVRPSGAPALGKSLLQWFLFSVVVSVFVAYLASFTLGHGLPYGKVFRFAGTAAFLGYGVYALQDSIWKGQSWCVSLKFVFDGLVYALVTAGAFAAFWPR